MNPFDPQTGGQYSAEQVLFLAMFAGVVVFNVWYATNARKRTIRFEHRRKDATAQPPPPPADGPEVVAARAMALESSRAELVHLLECAGKGEDPDLDFKRLLEGEVKEK